MCICIHMYIYMDICICIYTHVCEKKTPCATFFKNNNNRQN